MVNVASGGIVFAPGEAGTVQEVFQDATINYYTAGATRPTPMAFLGRSFWNPDPSGTPTDPLSKPVYPLVERLAGQARPPFGSSLFISDDPGEIVAFLKANDLDASPGSTLAQLRLGP